MDKLARITKPVEKEMISFNSLYKEALKGHSPDFQSMIDYISTSNGKKIRPLLVLLCAKACGKTDQYAIEYAIVLELLHTATLVHDDVVDDTKERRGRPSVNAKYDNRVAVLLGDYILSLSIVRAVMTQNIQILEIISKLAQHLADGELSQMSHSEGSNIDETHYFNIIYKKTAVLMASCSEMGAISSGTDRDTIEKLRLFGEYVGLCFQIKDDIFDYFDQGETGKPTEGNDIREGKVTLPLIYALKNAPQKDSSEISEILNTKNFTAENIKKIIEFAKSNGGIDYAQKKMEETKTKAIDILASLPDSEAKQSLLELVDYIIERNK